MPTLLFGCLCLFDFQGLIQLFENLLSALHISTVCQWAIHYLLGNLECLQLFFQKSLIPMIIQVPTIINILKISHAYWNSGAYLY